ncbi:hypothetical protein [Pseudodesulfovibrio mercurii]|uniref:hypothetical protein n=1 Tax=Pseudodesulfovibrio mercurii TaxID=641491 RepID=UPI0011D19F9D|nr:hypothetical protein [Pseudodesulfovibrio mercurii]
MRRYSNSTLKRVWVLDINKEKNVHGFSNFFKQKKMQDDPFEQTFGHKLNKMSAEIFGGCFPASMCFEEVIAHLDYGVDLSHLVKSKYVPK